VVVGAAREGFATELDEVERTSSREVAAMLYLREPPSAALIGSHIGGIWRFASTIAMDRGERGRLGRPRYPSRLIG
jgi:hypothetical protein